MDVNIRSIGRASEERDEDLTVTVVDERRAAVVAALIHVLTDSRFPKSQWSRHGAASLAKLMLRTSFSNLEQFVRSTVLPGQFLPRRQRSRGHFKVPEYSDTSEVSDTSKVPDPTMEAWCTSSAKTRDRIRKPPGMTMHGGRWRSST